MRTRKNKVRRKVYKGGTLTRSKLEFNKDYCQPQESLGCGRHALNNLLGGTYFVKEGEPITDENISTFDGTTKKISLQEVCKYLAGTKRKSERFDCPEDENYIDEVLSVGLGLIGYSAVAYIKNESSYVLNKNFIGFIVNVPRHWIALRKDGENYIKVDSLACGKNKVLSLDDIDKKLGKTYNSVLGVIFTGIYMAPGVLFNSDSIIPTNYGTNNSTTNPLLPNVAEAPTTLLPLKKPLPSRKHLAEERKLKQPNHYTRLMKNIRTAIPKKTNRLSNMRQRLNKSRKNRENRENEYENNKYENNNIYEEINLSQFNKNNVAEARRLKRSNDEALTYLQQIETDVKDMVSQGIKENRARIALELKGNKANAINWIKKRNRNNSV